MKSISKGTILRTIAFVIAIANQILTVYGVNPLPGAETEGYLDISTIVTTLVTIWTGWKNNSYTQAAIQADEFKDKLKAQENGEEL